MLELLTDAELVEIAPELEQLRKSPDRDGLRSFFLQLMQMPQTRKEAAIEELLGTARRRIDERDEFTWIVRGQQVFGNDIGLMCILMLNLVRLAPGEAMFCAAGDLHAYLGGFGVELMANSDNVLRGGCTVKHVDVPELMRVLKQ